jgi:hypothetical protein
MESLDVLMRIGTMNLIEDEDENEDENDSKNGSWKGGLCRTLQVVSFGAASDAATKS